MKSSVSGIGYSSLPTTITNTSLLIAAGEAMKSDLNKSEVEAYYTEMNLVEHEIQHMVDHLKSYMAPSSVGTDLLNIGGASAVYPDPLGVVCVIGAWNYPVQLTLMPCVGAIAAGNVCFIKVPSDKYTIYTSRALAELCAEHLDPAVFRLVEGAREMTQAVLDQRYDKIFFTGGSFVGKMVAAAAAKHLTPTVLELGGKSPVFVTESADITIAARRITWGAFMNAGQTCVRPDYCLVASSIAEKFYEEVEKCAAQFYSEDPSTSEFFGRVINERAAERLKEILDSTPKRAIRFGGDVNVGKRYISPTLLDFGTNLNTFSKSAAMGQEIFGPILPCYQYNNLSQVISFVRSSPKVRLNEMQRTAGAKDGWSQGIAHYLSEIFNSSLRFSPRSSFRSSPRSSLRSSQPLSCYLFTTSASDRDQILSNTTSGSSNVNDVMMHMCNPELPFGGVGASGQGRYHGKFSFDCFTHYKSVLFKTNYGDVWARYPPYDSVKETALGLVQKTRPGSFWQALKLISIAIVIALVTGVVKGDARFASAAHNAVTFLME